MRRLQVGRRVTDPEAGTITNGRARPAGALARAAAATLLGLSVANCAGTANLSGSGNKYGVVASPRVIPDGQPIPKGGGREMIGQPYVVGGRTYVPTDGKGYSREGWASWYGSAFHGRLTANGEVFDRGAVLAAHPTLPLPCYVRVTNVLNRRSMVVRVNDRGPYEGGRVIDVSERVAQVLDFHRRGTTRVRVEYLGKASTRGSDDRKLLATLRTDGAPALAGHGQPVMVADLREEPRIRPSSLPPVTDDEGGRNPTGPLPELTPASSAAPAPLAVAEVGDEPDDAPVPPTRPTDRSPGAPGLRPGMEPMPHGIEPVPPARPHLAGIY